MRRAHRILLGGLLWAGAGVGLAALARAHASEVAGPGGRISRWLLTRPRTLDADLPGPLRVGDPALDGDRRPIGRVTAIRDADGPLLATPADVSTSVLFHVSVTFDPEATLPARPGLTSHTVARNDGRWVLSTLLPTGKREMVFSELRAFARAHEAELREFVRPIAEDAIGQGMLTLDRNLAAALDEPGRRERIQQLLDEHRNMVKEELLPVLKRRLGPSARAKAQPLLRDIGRELWNELPMWSLGWSAFVDNIPGTSRTRVDTWFNEFVENKAIPILQAHEDELTRAVEELIDEGAHDPEVRTALGVATRRLASDPRFKQLVREIVEESLVKPFDVQALVERVLGDPAHQERLRRLEQLFAPTLQRIGRRLTVGADGRMDPDLARVLRRVVLDKDARWVEVEDLDAPPPTPVEEP